MNFFELDISYFRTNESLFVGLFHGLLFSIPFSVPFFLCLRSFLFEGIQIGCFALLGTLVGQFSFFSLMCSGYRPLIQFWYTSEPLFAFLGISLAFKLATDFYHQKISFDGQLLAFESKRNLENWNQWPFITPKNLLRFKVFFLQFCLMFLNPVFPATTTRLLLSQEILEHFGLLYVLGFFAGSFVLLSVFVFLTKALQKFFSSRFFAQLSRLFKKGEEQFGAGNEIQIAILLNKIFAFFLLGSVLFGSIQYTWRLFTQYPFEFIQFGSPAETNRAGSPSGRLSFQREFPSFDSNIRHREKNLPVERHIPVERINARRTLSGRPPLNEEQKSDAYLKYNSFFLNKFEEFFENSKIQSREVFQANQRGLRTYDEILQLQKIKERMGGVSGAGDSMEKDSFARSAGQGNTTRGVGPQIQLPKLRNNTKGKPKFSYIRDLFDQTSAPKNIYMHDDLHIYNAVFQQVSRN
jgi:hypothetical protein